MIEVTIDNDEENIDSIHETENYLIDDIMYSYDDINTIRNSIENMNKFFLFIYSTRINLHHHQNHLGRTYFQSIFIIFFQ